MKEKNSITKKIIIHADAEKLYGIWTDIEKWNSWTKSVKSISFLENHKFDIDGKAIVEQLKLSPAAWTITAIKANECFTWQTKKMGVTISATHTITSTATGAIAASALIYKGFLAGILYKVSLKLISQYLTMEINGLKAECEKLK